MTMTDWIKTFGKLALVDISSIPSRLRRHFWAMLAVLIRFHLRKAYEEKSLFFRLLFMPVIMIKLISSKIKAYRRGLPLLAFLKLETAELAAETDLLRREVRRQRTKRMEWLADIKPGATVNDLESLIEERSFQSLVFLRNSLWGLILSDKKKKED